MCEYTSKHPAADTKGERGQTTELSDRPLGEQIYKMEALL